MLNWSDTIFIVTVIAALGPLVDYFLLRKQKSKLYDICLRLWYMLSEFEFSYLPRFVAQSILRTIQHSSLVGEPIRWLRVCGISLCYSLFVTSFMSFMLMPHYSNEFRQVLVLFVVLWPIILIPFLINVPFDLMTVWFFEKTATQALIKPGLGSIVFIILNIATAALLAFTCLLAVSIFDTGMHGILNEVLSSFGKVLILLLENRMMPTRDDWEYTSGFLAISTFIPVSVFSVILFVTTFFFLLLKTAQSIIMFCLERVSENEPEKFAPFTMVGIICSVLILLVKVMQHFR